MIVSKKSIAISAALLLCVSAPVSVLAETMDGGHDMGAMTMSEGASSPAAAGYVKSMDAMHEAMAAVKYTGDPDVDFALAMIPHHQAAIEMAKVQLQYGKDVQIRKLSEEIIAAQEREIAQLRSWLADHAPAQ